MIAGRFDHAAWCGPAHPLAVWLGEVLQKPGAGRLAEDDKQRKELLKQLDRFDQFDRDIAQTASRSNDPTMVERWNGMKALPRIVLDEQQHIDTAARAFDSALGTTGSEFEFDRPEDDTGVLNKFGRIPPFSNSRWTPGVQIVYDFLQVAFGEPPEVKSEATPILAAGEILGMNDPASVLLLTVESLPGPPGRGLITPDVWSLGLVGFPGTPNDGFVSIMHKAFRGGLNPDRPVRLRWRLQPKHGQFPRVVQGHSAEAAAACCVRALMDQTRQTPGPLLDADVAITACLGPAADSLEDRLLEPVAEKTLDAKFQAAVRAKLNGVIVSDGQVPTGKTRHTNSDTIDGKPQEGAVEIATVATLGEAYDLITSKAIRQYKELVCDEWDGPENGKWLEMETPQEFLDASSRDQA